MGGALAWAAITTKLWVHFGFSQGRPMPCNFYNPPHTQRALHWVTALQFAPPLYWQTPTRLQHATNAISPPNDATLCYFHAVLSYVGNTISPLPMLFSCITFYWQHLIIPKKSPRLFKLWHPFQPLISTCDIIAFIILLYQSFPFY